MFKIVKGVHHFRRTVFAGQRELFEGLTRGPQAPLALFITCSDSRINPNLLTQTEPGELFILRNAGNIIPPHGVAGGEGATIEYAVAVLGIRDVIVCGHSHCGAVQALLGRGEDQRDLPAVRAWFAHAEATRRIVAAATGRLDPAELYRLGTEQNVLVQLDNLRTHPAVAAGLSRGQLRLYGWVYVIETGEVLSYDPALGRFAPLEADEPSPVPTLPPLTPRLTGWAGAR
jgi:carbonic anhydrase